MLEAKAIGVPSYPRENHKKSYHYSHKHKCSVCKKQFRNLFAYKMHVVENHDGKNNENS